jgi:hypothetical protein
LKVDKKVEKSGKPQRWPEEKDLQSLKSKEMEAKGK